MKIKFKKLASFILIISLLIQSTSNFNIVMAEEDVSIETFTISVETSDYYDQYEERIIDKLVSKKIDTEYGVRYSLFYSLTPINNDLNVETSLVFIGNEDGEIIEAFVLNSTNDVLTIENLLEDNITNLNMARGPVAQCVRTVCTNYKTEYGVNYDGFCSATIGTACFAAIGYPVLALVCRAGVVIACTGITEENVCTRTYDEIYACAL